MGSGWHNPPPSRFLALVGERGGCGPMDGLRYGPGNREKDNTMQAIETKYHGPGNVRGSRVTAKCERGKLTVSWDPSLNSDANHRRACRMLLEKFAREDVKEYGKTEAEHHWGDFVTGELESGVRVHVLVGRLSGWGMLRKAAGALDPLREEIASGRGRGLSDIVRLGKALEAVREALVEVEKEVEA